MMVLALVGSTSYSAYKDVPNDIQCMCIDHSDWIVKYFEVHIHAHMQNM